MKILYLTPGCFDKGGISRYNRYQIKVFQELYGDDSVKVMSILGPDANSFEGHFDVHWHGNGLSLGNKAGYVSEALRIAVKWKPDLVWVGHVNLSSLGWLLARLVGSKVVLNVYGLEVWSRMRPDAAFGLRNADQIVSDCKNTANYLTVHQIRKDETITMIWDCVDIERFYPVSRPDLSILAKYGIGDPDVYKNILTLGRLSKPDAFYKGYTQLMMAFERVVARVPEARLIYGGRGDFVPELKALAASKGLSEKVIFTGSITEEDLVQVYCSCAIFSLVTESGEGKGEGIPLTPLEAMACGKPILVGNQDGSREAIFDKSNGYLLDPKDIDSLANALERYLCDEIMRKEHAANARAIAERYFSFQRFKAEHATFLEKIIIK